MIVKNPEKKKTTEFRELKDYGCRFNEIVIFSSGERVNNEFKEVDDYSCRFEGIVNTYDEWFNNDLKELVRKRDNYTCRICGKRKEKDTLNVHHIDYDKKNSDISNLISLCRSCHIKTNFKRVFWGKFFNAMILEIYELNKVV